MTRKTAAWMPLYIDAYEQKTKHLSEAEDGVYGRLLRHYWVNGPLPDDDGDLARIARVDRRAWKKYRPRLIGFFTVSDGVWRQSRSDEELEKAHALSAKRAEAGAKGGSAEHQTRTKTAAIASAKEEQMGTHARVHCPIQEEGSLRDQDRAEEENAGPFTLRAVR